MLRIILAIILLSGAYSVQAALIEGDPKGNVTLVEIYDYQCLHCHILYPVIQQLMRTNPHLEVKLMPVAVLNSTSLIEAAAAIAAAQIPDGFEQLNAWLMQTAPLNEGDINTVLKTLGLTTPEFFTAMHSAETRMQLLEGLKFLKCHHLDGVPVVIIYPTQHPEQQTLWTGEQSVTTLQTAIQHAKKMA